MITSIANSKTFFFFSLLYIKSIYGSVSKYGTYVADVVEPAYVEYEMVTPVKPLWKYRTYSSYYPVYYGNVYSPYLVRELTSEKARMPPASEKQSHTTFEPYRQQSHSEVLYNNASARQPRLKHLSSKNASAPQASFKHLSSKNASAPQAPFKRLASKNASAPQAPLKRLASKNASAPQASFKRLASKNASAPQAPFKRLSSKNSSASQAPFKHLASKNVSGSKASSQHFKGQQRSLRAQERYIQNWSNYSQRIPFNISLNSNAMLKNAEPFSTYLRTISYTSNSSGLVTDYMKKKGLCSGDRNNSDHRCSSADSSNDEKQDESAPESLAVGQDSVPMEHAEIVKDPSIESSSSDSVGVPQSEGAYVSQVPANSASQIVSSEPVEDPISSNENMSQGSNVLPESEEHVSVIDGELVNKDASPDMLNSSSGQNAESGDSSINSESQQYHVQPSYVDAPENSQNLNDIDKKDVPPQPSAVSSKQPYQSAQNDSSVKNEYILVKVPAKDSQSSDSMVVSNSIDKVKVQNDGSAIKDLSFHSVSQAQPEVKKNVSSSESQFRGPGSEAVYIKSIKPQEKKAQGISAFQKVLKFINPLSHQSLSNESIANSSHVEQPSQESAENVSASNQVEYQELQFPINIPADGDFIFYGVLFGVEGTTLQEVKFTGEPDGRVRVGIEQGEFITDAFSLSEGSPITTVWSSNGDEARLLFVNQNGKNGFFLQVDKYKLGIIDKRFLVYNQ